MFNIPVQIYIMEKIFYFIVVYLTLKKNVWITYLLHEEWIFVTQARRPGTWLWPRDQLTSPTFCVALCLHKLSWRQRKWRQWAAGSWDRLVTRQWRHPSGSRWVRGWDVDRVALRGRSMTWHSLSTQLRHSQRTLMTWRWPWIPKMNRTSVVKLKKSLSFMIRRLETQVTMYNYLGNFIPFWQR